MLHITNPDEGLELFKTLGSDIRVRILDLLLENGHMSMSQLADHLNITGGALTSHIKKMEETGLIAITSESAGHGSQKICSVLQDRIIIDIRHSANSGHEYTTVLKAGQFSSHKTGSVCGMATPESVVGEIDDKRYFDHPSRYDAEILWFSEGFVEYTIPDLTPSGSHITSMLISLELSAAPHDSSDETSSGMNFYINGEKLGTYVCPAMTDDSNGIYAPGWWPGAWSRHGEPVNLTVDSTGTFLNGEKSSDTCINELRGHSDDPFVLRLEAPPGAGGITVFGSSFGNCGQDINITLFCENDD